MMRDPYPYEVWKAYLTELNEEAELLGNPRWILRRTPKSKDHSRVFLAMTPDNDPYWAGQDSEALLGEWFGEMHARRIGNVRRHIRACFYIASGEDEGPDGRAEPEHWPPTHFDGAAVDKTDAKHWRAFQTASRHARNMGLVDPMLIVDSKTPVSEFFRKPEPVEPEVVSIEPDLTFHDGIDSSAGETYFEEGSAYVTGYTPTDLLVPSIVEVWIEKQLDSPDKPIVENVCRILGVNVITGSGNMRTSQAYAALRRQQEAELPMRILFLSDFDASGDHMAVAPARHIQFAIEGSDPKPDIRLFHLALTEGQVREQNLPAKPPTSVKDEQAAKERYFSERTGGLGSVQLNALTDTGPRSEWFERLLTRAIKALRDPDLRDKRWAAKDEANELVEVELERRLRWPHRGLHLIAERHKQIAREGYEEEREAIAEKNRQITELIRERQGLEEDLREKLSAELDPLEERAEAILELASSRLESLEELELPTYEAEEPEGAAEGWLFDSRRGYIEQQRFYNNRKFGTPIENDDEWW